MEFSLHVVPFSGRGDFSLPSVSALNLEDLKTKLISAWNTSKASNLGAEINLRAEIDLEDGTYEVWVGSYEVNDEEIIFELNREIQDFCVDEFDINEDLKDLDETMNLLFRLDAD